MEHLHFLAAESFPRISARHNLCSRAQVKHLSSPRQLLRNAKMGWFACFTLLYVKQTKCSRGCFTNNFVIT